MATEARGRAGSELIRHVEVVLRADMTLTEIKRRVEAGQWPLPHSVMDRVYRWRRDEVEAWLETGEWPESCRFKRGVGKGREVPAAPRLAP